VTLRRTAKPDSGHFGGRTPTYGIIDGGHSCAAMQAALAFQQKILSLMKRVWGRVCLS